MDLNTIAEELFAKIRGRFPNVTIGNEEGNITQEPSEARFFEFTFKESNPDGDKISVSLDEEDGVVIMYADTVTENEIGKRKWYNFLRELRTFSKKRLLNFDVRNITKSNLEKRDYQYLARISGDNSMNESKLYGTSKLSYQDVDSARLVIKHTESVNTEVPTGRTRNIGAIYIESAEGERFKYPFKHLAGARAMARHVAEGGTRYDEFGSHIVDLSEELSKLRKFKNYMGRSKVMAESLAEYMDVIHGRINEVKKRIDSLQKPNFYKEAYETFEKPVFEEIPEDVKENWIDQLTIRQFNEELKDVFPYIYKLIGETNRVQDLGPEDFMSEDEEVEEGDSMGRKFHKAMGWGDTSPEDIKQEVKNMSDEDLKKLASFFSKTGERGSGSEHNLHYKLVNRELKRRFGVKPGKNEEQFSEDDDPCWKDYEQVGMKKKGGKEVPNCVPKEEIELERIFDEMMGQWAESDCDDEDDENESFDGGEQQAPLSEFILSFYDRGTGSFPKGETAILTMVEKDYGEQFIEPAKQFIEQVNHTFEQFNSRSSAIEEDQGDGLHGFFNEEKGPNDHPGVALRVIMPHPTAMGGYTTDMINFWGSMDAAKSGDDGLNHMTLDDVKAKGIQIHGSKEEAMQAAKAEHGEEGGKTHDGHDEYRRLRQLAGI